MTHDVVQLRLHGGADGARSLILRKEAVLRT